MMAGHEAYVAYALPEKQLVVIDATRMSVQPFTLETTLKNTSCAICCSIITSPVSACPSGSTKACASGSARGFPEIVFSRGSSPLPRRCSLARSSLWSRLTHHFPRDQRGPLSYEQSRSVVEHIANVYGRKGILNILQSMKTGCLLRMPFKWR